MNENALDALKQALQGITDAIRLLEEGDGSAAANLIYLAIEQLEYTLDLLPPPDKPDPAPVEPDPGPQAPGFPGEKSGF